MKTKINRFNIVNFFYYTLIMNLYLCIRNNNKRCILFKGKYVNSALAGALGPTSLLSFRPNWVLQGGFFGFSFIYVVNVL